MVKTKALITYRITLFKFVGWFIHSGVEARFEVPVFEKHKGLPYENGNLVLKKLRVKIHPKNY